MTPATWDEMTDTADAYAASAADWLFPRSFEPPSPPPRHRDRKLRRHSRLGRFFSRRPDQTAEKHLPYDEQGGNNGENNGLEGGGADGARRPSQGSEGGNSSGSTAEAVSIAALPEHSVAVDIALIEGMIPGPNGGAHPEKLNPGASPGSSPDLQSAGTPSASERHGTGRSTPQDAGDDIEAGRGSGPRDPGDLHAAVTQRIRSTMASSRVAPVPAATVDLVGKGGGAVPDPKSYAVTQYQPNLASMNGSVMGGGDSGGACGGGYMVTKSGRTKSLVRTRVEPKTFFANERTFLQWLNISVLVMFLALSLLR